MKGLLLMLGGVVLLLAAGGASASFSCGLGAGTPYCQYEGKVERVYVNDNGRILAFIPSSFDSSLAEAQGLSSVTYTNAFMYLVDYQTDASPEFAKMLYATLLSAQAQNRDVQMQMRKVIGGYLVIDRIWIN